MATDTYFKHVSLTMQPKAKTPLLRFVVDNKSYNQQAVQHLHKSLRCAFLVSLRFLWTCVV